MRKWLINSALGLVILCLAGMFLFESKLREIVADFKAFSISDVGLYTLAGERYHLPEGQRGTVIFYADMQGCVACLNKIVDIEPLARIYEDVLFFAVLKGGEDIEGFIQFMDDQGMPGEYLMDPDLALYYRLGISNHPTLMFFNRSGLMVAAIPFDIQQGCLRRTYHQYIDEL